MNIKILQLLYFYFVSIIFSSMIMSQTNHIDKSPGYNPLANGRALDSLYSDTSPLKPDYRNHKNIPEYDPSLMPLNYGFPNGRSTGVWTELNPKVPRVDYWGVYFINTDTGFACGVNGAIIKTTNSGDSWATLNSGITKTLKTIGSYDGSLIIAAGDSGIIITSTDLGETWQIISSSSNQNIWNIQMLTKRIGWLVGEGSTALKTTDGGNIWINQTTPLTGFAYWDVSFLDTLFGYISCNGGRILRTTDGGMNWDVKQAGDNYGLFTIELVTRTKAVALGFAGKHVYTSDGGDNWTFITFLGGSEPNNISFIDTLKGFAVGFGGCYETTNSGRNWNWRSDMVDGAGITFPAKNGIGYYVGKVLTIRKTTNAGIDWDKAIINDDFIDVFFTDDNTGWIVGQELYKSILYKTYDGGATILPVQNFPGENPSSVYFFDNLNGIVGAKDKIFKTSSGGINWEAQNISGYDSLLTGKVFKRFYFLDNGFGWAMNAGCVVKTTDNGNNWFIVFKLLNGTTLTGFNFTNEQIGWITSTSGLYYTTDGGVNWITQNRFQYYNLRDIYFNSNMHGMITCSDTLFYTVDGGTNWLVDNSVVNLGYARFSNEALNNIFLVGGRGYTYQSTNAGESWNEVIEIKNSGITFIRLNEVNKGYTIGLKGLVIKYYDEDLPVELTSFDASIKDENKIILRWSTTTETNNKGFTIESLKVDKLDGLQGWENVGFVDGAGTTTENHHYSFVDEGLTAGRYSYRLKQIDFDGTFEYSNTIVIEIASPTEFKLNQNFPNPFNPETKIEFQIPTTSNVNLTVFNVLGEKIREIVNEKLDAGYYGFVFNGENQSSGTYIYSLNSENYTASGKMILLK